MKNPSQEDLLGYVLGALDAPEQRQLEQYIDHHPEIEEELLDIKASLVPLDLLDVKGHRPGLARRTCELVANCDPEEAAARLKFLDAPIDFDEAETSIPSSPSTSSSLDRSVQLSLAAEESVTSRVKDHSPAKGATFTQRGFFARVGNWSFNDLLVGVVAMAVLAGLLFPAVSWSRYQSRLFACQNNLRQVGAAFMTYSSLNDSNEFITIPQEGNLSTSGCYGPILKDAGLLEDDSVLSCAGLGADVPPVFIPSQQQVLAASTSEEIAYLQQTMGGHFGHSMGHCKNDGYVGPRNGQAHVVLLADRPSADRPGRISLNHGGGGQNCLFADGRVKFIQGHAYGNDAIFENDYGVVAPGSNDRDNVIAASHLSPVTAVRMQMAPAE